MKPSTSWCQPVFRRGDEESCASGGDADGGAEESESVMEAAAGRDVNGTSPMDVAAEFECRAVVVWSDTVGHWGQAPGINGKREYFSFSFFSLAFTVVDHFTTLSLSTRVLLYSA